MKLVKQISTGRTVYREEPFTDKALSEASNFTGIPVSDLQVSDDNITEQQYEDRWHDELPWEEKMAKTDSGMPRYLEDHITDGHDGDAGNEFLQVKYDAKIKLRATKP